MDYILVILLTFGPGYGQITTIQQADLTKSGCEKMKVKLEADIRQRSGFKIISSECHPN